MVVNTEVRFSGTWRSLTNVEVKQSSVWRDCTHVEVKSGGVWRLVFEREVLSLSGGSGTDENFASGTATVEWHFQTNGEVWMYRVNQSDVQDNDGIDWTSFQTSPVADAWVRGTANSGHAPDIGDAMDVWQKIAVTGGSTFDFGWTKTGAGPDRSGTVLVEISTASDGDPVVDSAVYGGTAHVESGA